MPAVVPPLAARVTTPAAPVVAAVTLTTGSEAVPPIEIGAVPVTLVTDPIVGDIQLKFPLVSLERTYPETPVTADGHVKV